MFSKRKGPHQRSRSKAANTHESAPVASTFSGTAEEYSRRERERKTEAPMASPLQMTFDFELSPSPTLPSPFTTPFAEPPPLLSPTPSSRPQTHDGPLGSNAFAPPKTTSPTMRKPSVKSSTGLSLLPHIPQVASRNSSARGAVSREVHTGARILSGSGSVKSIQDKDKDNGTDASSNPPTPTSANFRPGRSSPSMASNKERLQPKRSQSTVGSPRMEASLFPARNGAPESPSSPPLPPMNRSFIDSRDKPYGQPQRSVMLQQNHSSPNVLEGRGPGTSARGSTPMYSSYISPRPSTQHYGRQSDYSGSTARPSTRASSHTAFSAGPIITVGTPYGDTADSFPLPQHVMTRPKTPGAVAQVAGVTVPTHHTSALKAATKSEARKSQTPKKKGRLLLLLQRRRSSQDREVVIAEKAAREAQEQALARQKDVLASGVKKPPPDFDPRIKGKVVHDFSSPREKRNTFDELDMPTQLTSPMQSPDMAPPLSPTMYPPRNESLVHREKRRSSHTAVFKENLDEVPDSSDRISSINAENRENKVFLQRASQQSSEVGLSQESAALPPFARRSQMLDPMQAALYRDDEYKRSSEPSNTGEHTSLSETGGVSPATEGSSSNAAVSPISPPSPFGSPRGMSQLRQDTTHDHAARPEPMLSKASPPLEENEKFSERLSSPSSAISASPGVDTINEGTMDGLTAEFSARRRSAQEQEVNARAVAVHNANGCSLPPETAPQDLNTASPASQSLQKSTSEMGSLEQTPELIHDTRTSMTESMQSTPTKLVDKRKPVAAHSQKSSTLPKHNPSNASRFSFQFGESAAEEQALEEKHRKVASREMSQLILRGASPDEDEDDYFDEDAIDDMDELEMQASQEDLYLKPTVTLSSQPGDGTITHAGSSQSSLYLQQARQALQKKPSYSDDGSVYDDDNIPEITDEADIPYADHPAFRAHSALGGNSRHNSMMPDVGYWRDSTIDHYMRDSYASTMTFSRLPNDHLSVEDNLSVSNRSFGPRSDFYLHPSTSTNSLSTPKVQQKPPLPHRNSGNSERNRAASGINFSSPFASPSSEKADPLQSSVRDATSQRHLDESSKSLAAPLSADESLYMESSPARSVPDVNTMPSSPAPQGSQIGSGAVSTPLSSARDQEKAEHASAKSTQDGMRNGSSEALSLISPVTEKHRSDRIERAAHAGQSKEVTGTDSASASRLASLVETTREHRHTSSALSCEDLTKMAIGGPARDSLERRPRISANSLGDSVNETAPTALGLRMHEDPEGIHDQRRCPLPKAKQAQQHGASTATSPSTSELARKSLPFARVGTPTSPRSPFSNIGANCPSRFAGFNFQNSPPQQSSHSRIGSEHSVWSSRTVRPADMKQSGAVGTASDGLGLSLPTDFDFDIQGDGEDEMYFDDGNFDLDINAVGGDRFNEDAFDDDNFLYRPNAAVNAPHGYGHRRIQSSSSVGDGPYPTFAMPNADKVRARDSRMMLEDLPLQTPIDPKYIPQRNPSEDAKRLGVSDKAPPVPVLESNREAFVAMQDNLQRYHAALAEAANKAAADGRFKRNSSVSSTQSTALSARPGDTSRNLDARTLNDEHSVYSGNEAMSECHNLHVNGSVNLDQNSIQASQQSHATGYSPHKMSFDFGFDQNDMNFDDYENDDDLVAAANAEALANDDEGFYGQEFQFYGRPRANSDELEAINGGYFGQDGDNGLQRNKSLREPNLTPITERSEFSTRSSFVGYLPGTHGPPSAAGFPPHSPALARMPVNPLMADDIASFDDLRRLRAQAFGGSKSNSNRSSQTSIQGPNLDTSVGAYTSHSGPYMQSAFSGSEASPSGNPLGAPFFSPNNPQQPSPSFLPQSFQSFPFHDSPQSATSSNGNPFPFSIADLDSTPRRHTVATEPVTAKKVSPPPFHAHVASSASPPMSPGDNRVHSRQGSGTEVTYVQEPDPTGSGKPRWVLERRRTSDKGELELVGRELVKGGWI